MKLLNLSVIFSLLFLSNIMMPMSSFKELIETNLPTIDHRTVPNLFALGGVSLLGYGAATDSPAISVAGLICGIVWGSTTYVNRDLDSRIAQNNHSPGREE